jgi:type I restriction enzyme, S subunit
MSSNEWKEFKLQDVCAYRTGKLNSNAAAPNGTYPFFTCSPETYKIDNYSFDQDAVILAGNNANGVFSIKHFKGKFDAYQRTYVINTVDESIINNKYLYYFLGLQLNQLKQLSVGSATKFLTKTILDNITIRVPSNEKEMRTIAYTLSSLDEKIQINNQINKTLESMAQAIFKHWFVDFEFPNKDGEPYKSSGGEMVESELGMIPKGWEVKSLSMLLESVSVKHKFPNEKIIFLNTSDVFNGEVLHNNYSDVSSLPGQAKKSIEKNDILYSEIRPQNRRFAFVDFDASDFVVSTKLMVLRSKSINPSILYFLLTSEDTINELQRMAESRSGTFPQITFDNLKYIKIAIPKHISTVLSCDIFSSILSNITHLKKENKELTKLRDTLLPKLMSGEIRVPLTEEGEPS